MLSFACNLGSSSSSHNDAIPLYPPFMQNPTPEVISPKATNLSTLLEACQFELHYSCCAAPQRNIVLTLSDVLKLSYPGNYENI